METELEWKPGGPNFALRLGTGNCELKPRGTRARRYPASIQQSGLSFLRRQTIALAHCQKPVAR